MRGSAIKKLGIPEGPLVRKAQRLCGRLASEFDFNKDRIRRVLEKVSENPEDWTDDGVVGELARELIAWRDKQPRDNPIDYNQWGEDIDPEAINQLENGCRIPTVEKGAIMADAHRGYGVPIGGVLASKDAILPGAVGVDIACQMKLTVTSIPERDFGDVRGELRKALDEETSFGMGAHFKKPDRRDHGILEDDAWDLNQIVRGQKDKAYAQLGSSGSGNHFAEWGIVEMPSEAAGIPEGRYVALLTHSGSRGPGATISNHYVERAKQQRPELRGPISKLAWLPLGSPAGQEFLEAMQLMGRYARACHETLHRHVVGAVEAAETVGEIGNIHNFAWIEQIEGEEYVVHRKGATPAREGQLGIIPGTMTDAAYIVEGKGNPEALHSASHGAGRVMSRTEARRTLDEQDFEDRLDDNDVELISGDLDESPDVYKDIGTVMGHQTDLVEPLGTFIPRIVKMAPPEEPSWETEES